MNVKKLILLSLLMFPLAIGHAQESGESGSEEDVQQAPRIIEEPAYEYFYWPEEDLNNFGLSTMGKGKSGSTLGSSTGRTSNVEANEYLRSKKEARKKIEAQEDNNGENVRPSAQEQPLYQASELQSSKSPSDNPIYEWRDENGNLHITNDLGKVPPEYQDQVYENRPGVPRQ